MEKIYFQHTYENYHANGSNRSYWSKFFKALSVEIGEENKMKLYTSYDENMPIYEYYSGLRGRLVRIMQFNPKNEIIKSEKYAPSRFYTAWIDERKLCFVEERSVQKPELVVCLLMTAENIEKAKKLISIWLLDMDDGRVRMEIDRIYAEQDRMDEAGR